MWWILFLPIDILIIYLLWLALPYLLLAALIIAGVLLVCGLLYLVIVTAIRAA
jgi:hypothetical protein